MKAASSLMEDEGGPAKEEKRNKSKKRRKKKTMANAVQKLYETCREVFARGGPGFVPPPADVQRLKLVLDSMKPEDVNLAPSSPYVSPTENEAAAPPITYLPIYHCDKFSIGIFCLPPSGVIPLHNHPGMTVFSKILFGSVHIKSYDWVTDLHHHNASHPTHREQQGGVQLAKVELDSDFTATTGTAVLYPAGGGNMHFLRALAPCAVLDVLGPPYNDAEGRHCTYYHDFPYFQFSTEPLSQGDDEYAWLQERGKQPEQFDLVGGTYEGPNIVEN